MSSLPLFDQIFPDKPLVGHVPLTGKDLRDEGIQRALDHLEKVKAQYIVSCLYEIRQLSRGTTLTSEDLRELAGEPPTGCENAIAGILKRAASKRHNLIVHTGQERPAKRPSIHSKNLGIWKRI